MSWNKQTYIFVRWLVDKLLFHSSSLIVLTDSFLNFDYMFLLHIEMVLISFGLLKNWSEPIVLVFFSFPIFPFRLWRKSLETLVWMPLPETTDVFVCYILFKLQCNLSSRFRSWGLAVWGFQESTMIPSLKRLAYQL